MSGAWSIQDLEFDAGTINVSDFDETAFHYGRGAWSTLFSHIEAPVYPDTYDYVDDVVDRDDDEHENGQQVQPSDHQRGRGDPCEFIVGDATHHLYDSSGSHVPCLVQADLAGQFFLAQEDDNTNVVTCYRRNTFHITGELLLASSRPLFGSTPTRFENEVVSFEVILSSHIRGDETRPVALTRKSAFDPATDLRTIVTPSTPTFEWRRIMFRHATQNNGRRAQVRQFFVLKVTTHAVMRDGSTVKVSTMHTRPVTVRGRNPAFYNHPVISSPIPLNHSPFPVEITQRSSEEMPAVVEPHTHSQNDVLSETRNEYTYVPITRAYWTPPVDILYRPHAAHHRIKPRTKRYFSELDDDG